MQVEAFKEWVAYCYSSKKVANDNVSRLKRVEKELPGIDLDKEYEKDRCVYLMSLFDNRGNNEQMKKYSHSKLPVGETYFSTYKYAIKKYVKFCDEAKKPTKKSKKK
jgi:hypothetical protein